MKYPASKRYQTHNIQRGLCYMCPQNGAIQIIIQDGTEVSRKTLIGCWTHILSWRRRYEKRKALK